MVDWSLSGEEIPAVRKDISEGTNRRKRRVGHNGRSKSRPLVESKPGQMVYSGTKKQRKTRPSVRKVKRDSNGNVMAS